ncbi:hypothetical protein FHX44_115969 [Pseudonocardia hierapolitana]|uniref:Uncharacterized protein n=1 Tax=Pseudonocardia hierapolitana TaxID=1128676 RepID=A0A561SYW7_9PSEU|nr:hypothetical protein FHX44_115969 [Pseudonocardia hierapolitana]
MCLSYYLNTRDVNCRRPDYLDVIEEARQFWAGQIADLVRDVHLYCALARQLDQLCRGHVSVGIVRTFSINLGGEDSTAHVDDCRHSCHGLGNPSAFELIAASRRPIISNKGTVLVVPTGLHAPVNGWAIFDHLSDLAQQMFPDPLCHEPVVGLPEDWMSHRPLRSSVGAPSRPPEPVDYCSAWGDERRIANAPSHDVTSLLLRTWATWINLRMGPMCAKTRSSSGRVIHGRRTGTVWIRSSGGSCASGCGNSRAGCRTPKVAAAVSAPAKQKARDDQVAARRVRVEQPEFVSWAS